MRVEWADDGNRAGERQLVRRRGTATTDFETTKPTGFTRRERKGARVVPMGSHNPSSLGSKGMLRLEKQRREGFSQAAPTTVWSDTNNSEFEFELSNKRSVVGELPTYDENRDDDIAVVCRHRGSSENKED
ncbi:hypothetical protein VTN77DRAFT_4301 [Rasamsonia byssochlamydoides]|uniref:uncharacterized protein n=1 Tax=Rasamsonia byssochlamydoides TaxID=89139 RepID=UPI003743040A